MGDSGLDGSVRRGIFDPVDKAFHFKGNAFCAYPGKRTDSAFLCPKFLYFVLANGGVPCKESLCGQWLLGVLKGPDHISYIVTRVVLFGDFGLDLLGVKIPVVQGVVCSDVLCEHLHFFVVVVDQVRNPDETAFLQASLSEGVHDALGIVAETGPVRVLVYEQGTECGHLTQNIRR